MIGGKQARPGNSDSVINNDSGAPTGLGALQLNGRKAEHQHLESMSLSWIHSCPSCLATKFCFVIPTVA